jgi:hypothetical protein
MNCRLEWLGHRYCLLLEKDLGYETLLLRFQHKITEMSILVYWTSIFCRIAIYLQNPQVMSGEPITLRCNYLPKSQVNLYSQKRKASPKTDSMLE